MKSIKFILIFFLGIIITPIFSLFVLSFKATNGIVFNWYIEILKNENFISAILNSFFTSLFVGALTVFLGFFISLSYFERKTRMVVLLFILLFGLMPPDIISISINKFAQIIGFNRSNIFFLNFGLLQYCLPFGIIILWTRYYFIDKGLITTCEDLGLNNKSIVLKILIPLSKSALVSVFLFSFLLTFNEYPRTYYLSGSTEYLSEFLNGKLSSGTDYSIYAGGTISILITCLIIVIYGLMMKYKILKNKSKIQLQKP